MPNVTAPLPTNVPKWIACGVALWALLGLDLTGCS